MKPISFDKPSRQIAFAIFSLHVLVVLVLVGDHWIKRRESKVHRIAIKTVLLQSPESKPTPLSSTRPSSSTPRKPQAPSTPTAAVSAPKPPVVAPSKKKKAQTFTRSKSEKDPIAPAENTPPSDLFEEISRSLDSIASSLEAKPKKTSIEIPSFSPNVAPSLRTIPGQPSAAEQIASLLEAALELPEFGAVKVRIEIDRGGSLKELEVLESQSSKNAAFLKKRLPELAFPCLNESASFTFVFRNADDS
jgi:outer membrane biosynthesis protein TonB